MPSVQSAYAGGSGLGFVRPGAVGYLGKTSALTPYSPPASGLPGAGNAPQGCSWQADGLHCAVANMLLDHVLIYGGITFTGTTLTITNSIIGAGSAAEYWCIRGTGMPAASAGGCISVVDSTLGWYGPNSYPAANDTAAITDNSGPLYNILRCDLGGQLPGAIVDGFPQGLNPATGFIEACWIHNVFEVNPGLPTHLDGVFAQGGINLIIRGCYIDVPIQSYVTGAVFTQAGGPIPNLTVDSCYLNGGSYNFYNENGTNCIVTNNTFGGNVNGFATNINADGGTIAAWYGNVSSTGAAVPNPYTPTINMVVTATETANGSNGIAMQVKVLDNAAGPGQKTGVTQAGPSTAITPTGAGSLVYGSQLGLAGTYTALGNTTTDQNVPLTTLQALSYRSTASPAQGSPVTLGYTASVNSISQVLAEILANGAIAEDASSPAGVSATAAQTVATASFQPPVNSWLVAMVQSNGGAGATTVSVTDNSGLALNWVEVIRQNVAGDGYTGIWMAQVTIP